MARKAFKQKLEVIDTQTTFDHLDEGDCFTLPGDCGFGEIRIGFPIWMKLDLNNARSIEDGRKKCFQSETPALKVRYGSIEKPE